MEDLATVPAIEIARRVRSGALSAVEVVDRFVANIERVNPKINALVADRFGRARAEAQAIDARVRDGEEVGAFAGVPFTTKEMASAEGLPVTAGSLRRRGAVATRDSTYVRRLRDEGAILLGVTNQSELGLWFESYNQVYGRTNNPYDLRRTAGGSSGGEGALVGAGAISLGVGSDMGGSIRLPSLFCGVFGHKPSAGIVPISGHFPLDHSSHRLESPPDAPYISIGPMARHAIDLLPALDVIMGACEEDRHSVDHFLQELQSLEGKRVYFLEDPPMRLTSKTSQAQMRAVRDAARMLADAGATVAPWEGPSMRSAIHVYTGMLAGTDETQLGSLLADTDVRLLRELTRVARGKSHHTMPSWMLMASERFVRPNSTQIDKLTAKGERLREEIEDYLSDDGVLLLPPFPRPAPRHRTTLMRPFDLAYAALFNVLGNPSTAVPMGLSKGLPTGVQIVGAWGHDHLTISAAVALENAGAGWIRPPVAEVV